MMAGRAGAKVPFWKSLRGRLSRTIVLLTTTAIFLVSWGFSSRFEEYLQNEIRDSLVNRAESSAESVGATLKVLAGQLQTFSAGIIPLDARVQREYLRLFLSDLTEVLTLSTYRWDAARKSIVSSVNSELSEDAARNAQFRGTNPAEAYAKLQQLELKAIEQFATDPKAVPRSGQPVYRFVSLSANANLRVFTLLIKSLSSAGSNDFLLVSSSVWLTSLIVALPKTSALETAVVDADGRIVASAVVGDVLRGRSISSLPVFARAKGSTEPSGFYEARTLPSWAARLPEQVRGLFERRSFTYTGKRAAEWVGAFSRVQKQGIGMDNHWVIVQKRADSVFGVVERTKLETILIAFFVIIGAATIGVMFAGQSTAQLESVYQATGEIASGRFDTRIETRSQDEIGKIADSVNRMAAELKAQVELKAEKGRLQAEADTARTVQETFFPQGTISTDVLTVTGSYQPATECGGDLWGHFTVRPGVEVIYIADAMGHGASAAIMTAMAYTSCNLIAEIIKDAEIFKDSPAKLLQRMNHVIFGAVKGKVSMTCFAVLYDFNKGEMVFANAGHNFPFVLFPATSDQIQKNGKPSAPQSLMLSGNPLGVDNASVYQDKRRPIKAGERLVMFTDGLIECRSPAGQQWGRKALNGVLGACASLPGVEDVRNQVLGTAFRFFSGVPIADDVTLVVAEVSRNWVAKPGYEVPAPPTSANTPTLDLAV
jgi:serine phosphatase RsbU (regulator of sigma subunit)